MTASLSISKKRQHTERFGNSNAITADVTVSLTSGESTYVMVDADLDALGLRRVWQVFGGSGTIRNDVATDVAIQYSVEIDDTTGKPTFFFWEGGGAGAPSALNNSNYTNLRPVRLTFIGK